MRAFVALVPLALLSAPAVAQTAQPESEFELPAELTDPAMGDRLGQMLGTLSRAMLDLPVGEIQAAVEGREPTSADRRRTIRDIAGRDASFDRDLQQQIAVAMPRMQSTMRAMAKSMPAMIRAMEKAADEIEREMDRATANIPQPGYPRQ